MPQRSDDGLTVRPFITSESGVILDEVLGSIDSLPDA